jgi:hypothetical protein
MKIKITCLIKISNQIYEIEFNILLLMYLKYITLRLQNTTIIDMNDSKVVFLLYSAGGTNHRGFFRRFYQKIKKTGYL